MEFFTAVALFLIVVAGYWIQSISGFRAVIFALPLVILFIDRSLFLPVALSMSFFQSLGIAYRDRTYIEKKTFLTMLGLACLGLLAGMVITEIFDETIINNLLGTFIILNSGYNLYVSYS